MPAAIRIDIHMGSIRGVATDLSASTKTFLDALATKLSEAVRVCIMESTNDVRDEAEGTLTHGFVVVPRIKEGLGESWPPQPDADESGLIGEGITEYVEKLMAGQWDAGLMREEAYDDGARYIHFSCDFG